MFLTAWCVSYIICFPFSTVFTIYFQLFYFVLLGARGRTRTDTPLRVQDFESSASTIPPLGQSCCLFRVAYFMLHILHQSISFYYIFSLVFQCFFSLRCVSKTFPLFISCTSRMTTITNVFRFVR